jgi:hypothetical protein
MDISSSANASFGSALMVASLAKKQQTQEGEAALKLLAKRSAVSSSSTDIGQRFSGKQDRYSRLTLMKKPPSRDGGFFISAIWREPLPLRAGRGLAPRRSSARRCGGG